MTINSHFIFSKSINGLFMSQVFSCDARGKYAVVFYNIAV